MLRWLFAQAAAAVILCSASTLLCSAVILSCVTDARSALPRDPVQATAYSPLAEARSQRQMAESPLETFTSVITDKDETPKCVLCLEYVSEILMSLTTLLSLRHDPNVRWQQLEDQTTNAGWRPLSSTRSAIPFIIDSQDGDAPMRAFSILRKFCWKFIGPQIAAISAYRDNLNLNFDKRIPGPICYTVFVKQGPSVTIAWTFCLKWR